MLCLHKHDHARVWRKKINIQLNLHSDVMEFPWSFFRESHVSHLITTDIFFIKKNQFISVERAFNTEQFDSNLMKMW